MSISSRKALTPLSDPSDIASMTKRLRSCFVVVVVVGVEV